MACNEIDISDLKSKLSDSIGTLIDIRGAEAWSSGVIAGARLMLTEDVLHQWQDISHDQPVYLMCFRGNQSLQLQQKLQQLYPQADQIYSVEGGYQAWKQKKLPVHVPAIDSEIQRYSRQLALPGFGHTEQSQLKQAKVLIVGAGGLGSPCAMYLAASGVGTLVLVDDDRVELSNLHRQVIHNENQLGVEKVLSARHYLQQLNSEINVEAVVDKLSADNIHELLDGVDLVIDGSDNMATRYLVNDHCYAASIPFIFAAVHQFEIQLSVFDFRHPKSACYRCVFPENDSASPPNCDQAGVLGVTPGLAGVLQATEAIKLITETGDLISGSLLSWNIKTQQQKMLKFMRRSDCQHGQ
ncbi:ThiF family adenylyltransferase [Marinicella sp. W31]|uniref:ThiF family adenylyltransferase n=1 Tax=Marinicella sp. W31 TaxID=3023713 RepID=UPI0037572998